VPLPVLDASAFLAYLRDEAGAAEVAEAIGGGAAMSAVNLAETLSTASERGVDPGQLADELRESGLLDGAIEVEPFTTADAIEVARLRPLTRDQGLSLGDRACLALARRLGTAAYTADSTWSAAALDVELRQIRQ
jgi:PIN domain nuclease of toxin-antitoxin system